MTFPSPIAQPLTPFGDRGGTDSHATFPSLRGKTCLITGGATGIGAALVEAFRRQGAAVGFIDVQEVAGERLAQRCGAHFVTCDVTDTIALCEAIETIAGATGAIDVLVNNAANDTRADAAAMSAADWRASLAINLDPVFVTARAVHSGMKARGCGAIINLSSINTLLGPSGLAGYVAAKGAVNALTKSLAREWGPDGIRVNAVSPGWVVTQRQLDLWLTAEAEAEWMKAVALKRRISPADVAGAVLFLASDEAAAITGQNLVVDGGRT